MIQLHLYFIIWDSSFCVVHVKPIRQLQTVWHRKRINIASCASKNTRKVHDLNQSQGQRPLVCVTVLVLCFQMRDFSVNVFILQLFSVLKTSLSSAAYLPSPVEFSSSHHNWKEVGGRVLPAGFLPSQWLPVDV